MICVDFVSRIVCISVKHVNKLFYFTIFIFDVDIEARNDCLAERELFNLKMILLIDKLVGASKERMWGSFLVLFNPVDKVILVSFVFE